MTARSELTAGMLPLSALSSPSLALLPPNAQRKCALPHHPEHASQHSLQQSASRGDKRNGLTSKHASCSSTRLKSFLNTSLALGNTLRWGRRSAPGGGFDIL